MAERQETSVMASIQDILRDAQLREEQEKQAAQRRAQEEEQRRIEAARRQQEEEEARIRAEEEERQRRAFEEQRKHAELQALQEATIQRAKMEAEAQARLAEMAARQEHERQLNALKHDKSKKQLKWIAIGAGAFVVFGGIGAGIIIKQQVDKTAALEADKRKLLDDQEQREAKAKALQDELNNTKDPEKIRALEAQLAENKAKLDNVKAELQNKHGATGAPRVGGGGPIPKATGGGGGTPKPCNCTPGDPLCSCL
jgi:colicin import membrane protein